MPPTSSVNTTMSKNGTTMKISGGGAPGGLNPRRTEWIMVRAPTAIMASTRTPPAQPSRRWMPVRPAETSEVCTTSSTSQEVNTTPCKT